MAGYYEEYKCGCTSNTVRSKRDLVGYCGKHGDDRRYVHRSDGLPDPEAKCKLDKALATKGA